MKKLLTLLLTVTLLLGVSVACAETDWPTGPVEAVLTASAGGDTDFNARTFATYFEQITGQPMIVTNMAGGGGTIATSYVKDSVNDGSVFLFCHTGQMIVNEVSGLADYGMDAFEISCIPAVNSSYVLVASKASGITSVADMIEKAQAAPGEVIYGTEMGGYTNLQALQIEEYAEIDLKIVDTGSASEKVVELLAGRIDLGAVPYSKVADYQTTGELTIIAQYGETRNEYLEGDIPTLKECGIDLVDVIPYIISFPKGTDEEIVARMSDIATQISQIPEYAETLRDGYKQTVQIKPTAEAIEYLTGVRERYMGFKKLLQGE